jgi:uncharacterized membrane protein
MDTLSGMEKFIVGQSFAVPMLHVVLVMAFFSICVIWGKFRIGLLGTYFLFLYWGFIANGAGLIKALDMGTTGLALFVLTGISMVFIGFVGFFRSQERH